MRPGPLQPRRSSAFVPHDLVRPLPGRGNGPLTGLTYVAKDMFAVKGERCSGGSPEWLSDAAAAKDNARVIDMLGNAGACLIGKTVCDEFFYSLTGTNDHYGTPVNSRWPGRLPGGSSSGSASAVAAGCCDFALGSDTGGSIRVPAAFCGAFGIRTTVGAIDMAGAMAMAPSFDTIGWFAPSAGVLRRVGEVLLPHSSSTQRLPSRIVVPDDVVDLVHPNVAHGLADLTRKITEMRGPVERAHVYGGKSDEWIECFRHVQAAEVAATYGDWIRARQPRLGPGIAERIAFALEVDKQTHRSAQERLNLLTVHIRSLVPAGTVLLMPTTPCEPPPLDASPDALQEFRTAAMRLTCIAGLGRLPQVAIPIAGPNGPLSVSLVGPPSSDRQLLDLAVELAQWIGT